MSKADDVFWRQFGVVLILLTVFGFAMYFVASSIGGQAYAEAYAKMNHSPDAVLARIAPVGRSRIGDPAGQTEAAAATAPAASAPQTDATRAATAPAATDTGAAGTGGATQVAAAGGAVDVVAGEKVYQSACFACHLSGAAGAPKLDDLAAWEPRLGQGMTGLLQSVINGKGAMPPKGGFSHLTDDDVRNAVAFMLEKAGLSVDG